MLCTLSLHISQTSGSEAEALIISESEGEYITSSGLYADG